MFCANRLSSVLASGKPDTTMPSSAREPSGLAALVLMHTDESFKGAAYLSEAFTDPATAHSFEATHSPWNIAAKTDLHLFEYYQRPENARLKRRFSLAMEAATKLEPAEAILSGFEWAKLPKESVVVDVGGGVGATTFLLAKALPELRFIVQDRPEVITDAQKYWDEKAPEFLRNNRVRLLAHDFFAPLPSDFHGTTMSAFLLRCIIHDWPDALALKILRNLRAAAHPSMHLVVVDVLLPYTCADTHLGCEIPGASRPPAPEPLLPNGGAARNMQYFLDFQVRFVASNPVDWLRAAVQMYVLGNCQERTLGHFVSLAAQGGWKVVQVYHIRGSAFSQCVAVPL
uniref:O-methyltransferase C-terminal domain-containing protein n=1 Tax=Mycena chlorophos TaxID=658473 RepID=A0ABQ0LGY6_MYCCL|nr:predicted protein [Mycena chlorophos]